LPPRRPQRRPRNPRWRQPACRRCSTSCLPPPRRPLRARGRWARRVGAVAVSTEGGVAGCRSFLAPRARQPMAAPAPSLRRHRRQTPPLPTRTNTWPWPPPSGTRFGRPLTASCPSRGASTRPSRPGVTPPPPPFGPCTSGRALETLVSGLTAVRRGHGAVFGPRYAGTLVGVLLRLAAAAPGAAGDAGALAPRGEGPDAAAAVAAATCGGGAAAGVSPVLRQPPKPALVSRSYCGLPG